MSRSLIACSTAFLSLCVVALPTDAATVQPNGSIQFIVSLPLRNEAELTQLIHNQTDPRSPLYHHFLTPAQFRLRYGAAPQSLAAISNELQRTGFAVEKISTQAIEVSGSRSRIENVFHTHVSDGRRIGQQKATLPILKLSPAFTASKATIIGFGQTLGLHPLSVRVPLNRNTQSGDYWFDDLKQAYAYPSFQTGYTGTNATVGILIDSAVNPHDLIVYGQHEKFSTYAGGARPPTVHIRPVLGGAPAASSSDPYNPNGDGSEAALDMEQLLGSAPGANALVYDVPDLSDSGIIAGDIAIVEDNAVDIVSSSIGGCELQYFAQNNGGQDYTGILRTYHDLFQQGNAEGISWVAASGDSGGLTCPSSNYFTYGTPGKFVPSVDSPASDPNVTAVGGTNLVTTPPNGKSLKSQYITENAYGDPEIPYDIYGFGSNVAGGIFGSGSGPSAFFAKPSYQNLVTTHQSMRTIPDVSMQMGGCPVVVSIVGGPNSFCGYAPPIFDKQPRSAVVTYYSGPGTSATRYIGLIGTSASAPEFAGLLAIKAQTLGSRLGNANELIYSIAAANHAFNRPFFHQGIPGYNGVIRTNSDQQGYSGIVGVGTPYAANFLGLSADNLAGDPQTTTNP